MEEAAQASERTIVLVRHTDEDAARLLASERDRFDAAPIRAVFLVTARDVRMFGQLCPAFWEKRDRYAAWPVSTVDRVENESQAERARMTARATMRMQQAARLPPGRDRALSMFKAARDAFHSAVPEEAESELFSVIEPLKQHGLHTEIGEAYEMLGVLTERRGDWRHAEDWYEQALEVHRAAGNTRGVASTSGQLGSLRFRQDDVDGALRYLNQALQYEEQNGDHRRLSDALRRVGMVREREGALRDASTLFQRALDEAGKVDDEPRMARCYHHIGRMKERMGLLDDAIALYTKSYHIKVAMGDDAGLGATLHQMGNTYFHKAEYDQAIACYRQALGREHRIGDVRGMSSTLVQLGLLLEQRCEYEEAFRTLLRAIPTLRRMRSGVLPEVESHAKRCRSMVPDHIAIEIEKEVTAGARAAVRAEQELAEKETLPHRP
jgi:tetratricopeptide (TPR) repeat protein